MNTHEIRETIQEALDEYGRWSGEVLYHSADEVSVINYRGIRRISLSRKEEKNYLFSDIQSYLTNVLS